MAIAHKTTVKLDARTNNFIRVLLQTSNLRASPCTARAAEDNEAYLA